MSLTSIIFVGPSDELVGYRDDVHGGHAGGGMSYRNVSGCCRRKNSSFQDPLRRPEGLDDTRQRAK
jgi:hypothetical protein